MSTKVLAEEIARSLETDGLAVAVAMNSLEYYHGPAQPLYYRDKFAFADDLAFELSRAGQHITCFDILSALDRMTV